MFQIAMLILFVFLPVGFLFEIFAVLPNEHDFMSKVTFFVCSFFSAFWSLKMDTFTNSLVDFFPLIIIFTLLV